MTHNFFPKPRIGLKLSETSFSGKNNPRGESEAENLKNKIFEIFTPPSVTPTHMKSPRLFRNAA